MSVYSMGLGDDESGDVPFLPSGAFSESPGLLKQDIETLDREIEVLAKDAKASKLAPAQKAVVTSFLSEWNNFLHRHSTYIDRSMFARSTVRRIQQFRKRLDDLRTEMKKLKVKVTLPAPRVEPFKEEGQINWKKILLIVGGVAVVTGGGVFLYRKFKGRKPVENSPPATAEVVAPQLPRVQHVLTV